MTDRTLVPTKVAARMLGVSWHTIKNWSPGELPFYRVGTRGDRRYDVAEVERYLQERREDKGLR